MNDSTPLFSDQTKETTYIDCYMFEFDDQLKTCSVPDIANSAVSSFLSIPVIGLLIRVTPLVSLVDEFSFYVYHKAPYDRGFLFISELCWNWTNSKWLPPFMDKLNFVSDYFENIASQSNFDEQTIKYTNKFADLGESTIFYNNITEFLIFSLPFSFIIFLALMAA